VVEIDVLEIAQAHRQSRKDAGNEADHQADHQISGVELGLMRRRVGNRHRLEADRGACALADQSHQSAKQQDREHRAAPDRRCGRIVHDDPP
jgi:hypothetical protein